MPLQPHTLTMAREMRASLNMIFFSNYVDGNYDIALTAFTFMGAIECIKSFFGFAELCGRGGTFRTSNKYRKMDTYRSAWTLSSVETTPQRIQTDQRGWIE
jgi:hypothetical protein